jgi:hypothetical protein
VCCVPDNRWDVWIEAVARAKHAAPGRTIDEYDPLMLGVHKAIHHDHGRAGVGDDLEVLTPYVVRDHDHKLRDVLRSRRSNQLVVLVAGSSTGKTRACYEAVREVLPGWHMICPSTADELLTLLTDGIKPGTVIWLNETQRFLQPPLGKHAAVALQRLLDRPTRARARHVIVLGSMWLKPYWQDLTRPPEPGKRDVQPQVRDLLTVSCVRIDVAEDFSEITDEQRADLRRVAEKDPRLRAALAASGDTARLTQVLAGGPRLLQHYADLNKTDPAAYALLTAAMDANRIGYQSPLPTALLKEAVPSYLGHAQRVAPLNWFNAALAEATREIHGVRALTPIRNYNTMGNADAYKLHDYLVQHALRLRRRKRIPMSMWTAVAEHTPDPDLLLAFVTQSLRSRTAEELEDQVGIARLRTLANSGDTIAAHLLAEVLAEKGDKSALAELRTRAHLGDRHAAGELAGALARLGDEAALVKLRNMANSGDVFAARLLALVLGDRARDSWQLRQFGMWQRDYEVAVGELRDRADIGDNYAARLLAEVLADRSDENALAELRSRANAGNWHAERALARVLADRGDNDAVAELRARADTGDNYAAQLLAQLTGDR